MTQFKVSYLAKDGTRRNFNFETDRRLFVKASGRSGCGWDVGFPFVDALGAEISKRNTDETSKMYQHGGLDRIIAVRNMQTGFVLYW